MGDGLVIETRDLTKRYGRVVAVDQLSLEVSRGGVFGLLGPNGSGKTTTIGMLLGLVRPSSGGIRLFGREAGGVYREDLRRVGAIVETPTFYPYLSGRANLRYFQGITGQSDPEEIERLLDLVDLTDSAHRPFSTYSLGMKQRLGVAYAMLGDPELIFLDEPTNGLDPAGMAEVRELVRALGRGGRTVLLSSHLLSEVEQVCDRVAILSHGRLLTQGDVRDLVRQRGVVRLRTTDDGRATEVLAALPEVERVDAEAGDGGEGTLLVEAPDLASWQITRTLAEQGVYVGEMAPVQITLERYFLEVTGETGGEHELAAALVEDEA